MTNAGTDRASAVTGREPDGFVLPSGAACSVGCGILRVMDKHELKAIQGFLSVVGAGRDAVALQDRLSELSRIIQRLMNARLGTGSLRAKVRMATLERNARRHRRQIKARLSEDNSTR